MKKLISIILSDIETSLSIAALCISILAIISSIIIAIRQGQQAQKIALLSKRDELLTMVLSDTPIDKTIMKIYYKRCLKKYNELEVAKAKITSIKLKMDDYLCRYAEVNNISKAQAGEKIEQLAYESDRNGDNSFEDFCNKNTFSYYDEVEDEMVSLNYAHLCLELTKAKDTSNKIKGHLTKKMQKYL